MCACNLNAAMKNLVPGPAWAGSSSGKALRFHPIVLPGRVVRHAGRQSVRLSAAADTLARILSAQRRLRALAGASPGQARTSCATIAGATDTRARNQAEMQSDGADRCAEPATPTPSARKA